jgi:hypothetical protein
VVDPTYVRSAEEILAELPPAPVAGQEAVPGETAQPADRPFFPVDGLSIASYSARTTPAPVRSTP